MFLSQELSPRRRDKGFAGRRKGQQGFPGLWEHAGWAARCQEALLHMQPWFPGFQDSTPASEEARRAGESLFAASQPEDGRDGNTS